MSPDEEVMKILEMVADKKITAEEGAELIAAFRAERSFGAGAPPHSGAGSGRPDFEERIERLVEDTLDSVFSSIGRPRGARGEGTYAAEGRDREVHYRVGPLDPGVETLNLHIEATSARLTLAPGPSRDVVATYHGPAQTRPSVSLRSNRLVIEQPHGHGVFFHGLRWMDGPRLDVQIPEGLILTGSMELQNGTCVLKGFSTRSLHVETTNGTIDVSGRSLERSTFETRNGAITVAAESASGVSCEATNGKIDLAGVLREVSLETVNGRIFVEPFQGSKGSLSAETARGAIHVRLPAGLGLKLDAESQVGSVDVSMAASVRRLGHIGQSVHTERGDGALRISLETQLGSIKVEERMG